MSTAQARWGDQIAVENVNGVPYRMYVEQPRRVEDLLMFATRWGTRPHIIQGDRVLHSTTCIWPFWPRSPNCRLWA